MIGGTISDKNILNFNFIIISSFREFMQMKKNNVISLPTRYLTYQSKEYTFSSLLFSLISPSVC